MHQDEAKSRVEYFNFIGKNENLLVVMLEIKDSYFYINHLGEDNFQKILFTLRDNLEKNLGAKCFVYKEKKILISQTLDIKQRIRTQIKRMKRRIKKVNFRQKDFFDFLHTDFVIGIAFGKKNNIVRNASIALGYSKRNQLKNTVYSIGLFRKTIKEREEKLEEEKIRQVVLKGQIIPYYQKIIDNSTLEVFKYEALARIHYQNKTIEPYVFLPIIKSLKFEEKFAREIIKKVFLDVYIHKKINASSINVNVNDIKNKSTVTLIEDLLKKYGGDRITFEIVETLGIDNYSILTNFTKMIKQYGAKVSIDDFGSGHSGYEHLINIDVDYLKIDGKFIDVIKKSKKTQSLVKGLSIFSKEHNIKTIAEFVEDEETYQILKSIGIDYSQGYYFGKPMYIKIKGEK